MSIKEQWWAQTRTATCAAGLPLPGPPSGLRNTSTTESPRKNILLMNRSLLTGLPLDFFGISVHISGSRETKITKKGSSLCSRETKGVGSCWRTSVEKKKNLTRKKNNKLGAKNHSKQQMNQQNKQKYSNFREQRTWLFLCQPITTQKRHKHTFDVF